MTYKVTYFKTMKCYNVSEAKAHFSSMVEAVQEGASVFICKRNVPVARVTPILKEQSGKQHRTVIGWARGSGIRILDDLTAPIVPQSDWDMLR